MYIDKQGQLQQQQQNLQYLNNLRLQPPTIVACNHKHLPSANEKKKKTPKRNQRVTTDTMHSEMDDVRPQILLMQHMLNTKSEEVP